MLDNFLNSVKNEANGFRFGSPWRISDSHVVCVVPIRRDRFFERDYVVFEELSELNFSIEDSGSISEVLFSNHIDERVFVRLGTMFRGIGTQSRAAAYSTVISKMGKMKVPVKCVHQSHPISGGAKFARASAVPMSVMCSLGGQASTWSSVVSHNMGWTARSSTGGYSGGSVPHIPDNLVSVVENIKNSDEIKKILKNVPLVEDQVGLIIVDKSGIYSVELFEHPESWKAVQNDVHTGAYEKISEKADSIFEVSIKDEKLKGLVSEFILKVQQAAAVEQTEGTFTFRTNDIAGEYTILKKKVIHVFAYRCENGKDNPLQANETGYGNTRYRTAL